MMNRGSFVNEDNDTLTIACNPALGEVSLLLRSIVTTGFKQKRSYVNTRLPADKIHERSKKAGIHRVQ
jgi:hypothetical protein